ncbi:MAG: 7-cyano-7-deazaguanine synthase QueC [Candidatus Brocadiales bacterium]
MKAGLAVVLLSGGMDSCVVAAIANESFELACLHANYKQRTEVRELKAFNDIASYYGVPEEKKLVINMGYLGAIGGSSLTDSRMTVPTSTTSSTNDVSTTYVPFRNTHLLMAAVSWAEVVGAEKVFIGAVEDDRIGYPDCREQYYRIFNKLVDVGTRPETRITVETPLIHMKKGDIVRRGVSLGAPFHLSWSCYKEEEKACGRCQSCLLRHEAFSEAGYKDPIPYQTDSL